MLPSRLVFATTLPTADGLSDGIPVAIPTDPFEPNLSGPTGRDRHRQPPHGTSPILLPPMSPSLPLDRPLQSDRRWLTPDTFAPKVFVTIACLAGFLTSAALYIESRGESSFARRGALATGALFLSNIGFNNFA